jgi:hypothetical protein
MARHPCHGSGGTLDLHDACTALYEQEIRSCIPLYLLSNFQVSIISFFEGRDYPVLSLIPRTDAVVLTICISR